MTISDRLVDQGRETCPRCGKPGIGYAPHPHAQGCKDHSRLVCRYCKARFKFKRDS